MDLVDLHRAALDAATALLRQVTDAQLRLPTPCTAWDVRALIQHMVAGNWMAVALLAGIEPDRATDHLAGNTAVDAYRASADAATTAFAEPGALARSVQIGRASCRERVCLAV